MQRLLRLLRLLHLLTQSLLTTGTLASWVYMLPGMVNKMQACTFCNSGLLQKSHEAASSRVVGF